MESKNKKIDIVMATYNGEKYISEQLDSIINSKDFDKYVKNIIIVDDGSTDNTINIVSAYCAKYKNIIFTPCSERKLGAAKNFEKGMLLSNAPYVMLCDQDDVWLSNKISLSFEKIQQVEDSESSIPCLVFSDLKLVDSRLKTIYESFFDFNKVKFPKALSLAFILSNNVAPGCTMILNKALVSKALPMPQKIVMHDWWLMIFSLCYGKVFVLNEKTMLYRQHNNNTVGINRNGFIKKCLSLKKQIYYFFDGKQKSITQAKELHQTSDTFNMSKENYSIVSAYTESITLYKVFSFPFWRFLFKTENGFFRKCLLICFVLHLFWIK